MNRLSGILTVWLLILTGTLAFSEDTSTKSIASTNAPEATTYQIRNLKYGMLLRPQDANHATGTPIVLHSAQPWKCMTWKLQPAGSADFRVQNLFTSKTFSLKSGNDSQSKAVIQVPLPKELAGHAPVWQFAKLESGQYKITDPKTGEVLTAISAEDGYSYKVIVKPWENLDEQKWILEQIDPKDLTM